MSDEEPLENRESHSYANDTKSDSDHIKIGDIKDSQAVAAGRGATATVINQYITNKEEQPPLFTNVPDFPRYGLVGRDDLLQDLVPRLTADAGSPDPVRVAISGTGGVGKTALAVALAHQKDLLSHFTDGVLWGSVGPGGDPLLALQSWAEALGLDPKQYPEPAGLKSAVKNRIATK